MSENFFSGMKVDLGLTKQGYKTLLPAKEVRGLVNDYMPWYNTERIQKKLNYLSPVHYREAFLDQRLRANGIVSSPMEAISEDGAAGARLGPSARPFGDGASPPPHPRVLYPLDTTNPLL